MNQLKDWYRGLALQMCWLIIWESTKYAFDYFFDFISVFNLNKL